MAEPWGLNSFPDPKEPGRCWPQTHLPSHCCASQSCHTSWIWPPCCVPAWEELPICFKYSLFTVKSILSSVWSVNFDKCIQLCDYHQTQAIEPFYHPKKIPNYPLKSSHCLQPHCLDLLISFLSVQRDLTFPECPMNRILIGSLEVWLLWLSLMHLRVVYVVVLSIVLPFLFLGITWL